MKEIKDYLHLYLPVKAIDTISGGEVFIQGISRSEGMCQFETENNEDWGNIEFFKPILRPLSSMTLSEEKEILGLTDELRLNIDWTVFSPQEFHLLLSKHFDLFGLIEAGLAIDATTINQPASNTGMKNNYEK
jgi:hypothetical protein